MWTLMIAAPAWSLCLAGSAPAPLPATSVTPARPEAVRLALDPASGTRLHKRFAMRHSLVVKENELLGKEQPRTKLDNLEMQSGAWIHHFDDFKEVVDGRMQVLRRRFETIRLDAQAAIQSPTGPLTDSLFADSPLTGKSVVFTRRADDSYSRYYDVEEAPEELLPRLSIDTNFACLLPDREVAPGDTWTIEPAALRDVFGYAGDVELVFSGRVGDILLARNLLFGVGGSLWHAFAEQPNGTAKGTLVELREVDGRRVAAIGLELDIDCKVDQTALANEKRNAIELTSEMEVAKARLEVELEGDGELLWDLDRNLPYKLQIVCAESVYTSRIWKERTAKVTTVLPTMPSQGITLIGVVRIDLETSVE